MSVHESLVVVPLLVAIAFHVALSLALHAWGRRVARRCQGRWWRRASWAPLAALGLSVVGMSMTVWRLTRGFGEVGREDPAYKAEALSRHISDAMQWTLLFGGPAAALYLAGVVTFLVGTLRRPDDGPAARAGLPSPP